MLFGHANLLAEKLLPLAWARVIIASPTLQIMGRDKHAESRPVTVREDSPLDQRWTAAVDPPDGDRSFWLLPNTGNVIVAPPVDVGTVTSVLPDTGLSVAVMPVPTKFSTERRGKALPPFTVTS